MTRHTKNRRRQRKRDSYNHPSHIAVVEALEEVAENTRLSVEAVQRLLFDTNDPDISQKFWETIHKEHGYGSYAKVHRCSHCGEFYMELAVPERGGHSL